MALTDSGVPDQAHHNVGHSGLDPGNLGAILPDPWPFLNVQICWSNEEGRSPTFSEILPSSISWLDDWLDKSSYAALANVRFETSGGDVIERRFGADEVMPSTKPTAVPSFIAL